MTNRIREAGEFCWINMLTPDPSEAREFFGKVLGWTYFEMPGMGHGIMVGGRNVGGLFDLNGPNTPPGLSPMIGVMIKVNDTDATCERLTSLGGKAKPAFDVGKQGRMAVCFDPLGAEFDVWEPKSMHGTDVDRLSPGAPTRFELVTTDLPRVSTFYSALFGWTSVPSLPPDAINVKPRWITCFRVTDAGEAAQIAINLGAEILSPATDRPGIGRACGLRSPQGVEFFVMSDAG